MTPIPSERRDQEEELPGYTKDEQVIIDGTQERTPVNEAIEERKVDVPPNGGYGWVCIAAVAIINAHTWGLNSAYAVFLAYYLSNNVFPGATPLQYAFVGGLSISQALIIAPIATLNYPPFQHTFASQTWHLFLSQGICFGWGMGFLFVGSVGIPAQWFSTRRSLATGCCTAGSGLGGLVYSLSAQAMIRNIGLPWAFRTLAVIAFVANTASALLIRDRNKQIGSNQLGFDYRLFRKVEFLGLLMFGFLSMLGYVVLLFSLPNYARTIGLSSQQGSVIGAVFNLGQALVSEPIGLEIVAFNGGSYTGAILFTGWMYIGPLNASSTVHVVFAAAALVASICPPVLWRSVQPTRGTRASLSPWTAPSPTRTLGHSSPELPLLPSFSVLGNRPRTPSTAARRDRTDTSYYTASWGSPYRHPPPTFDPSRVVSTNFGSDDFDEESSGLQFGLGHLLPSRLDLEEDSPNRFNLEHLIPRLDQDASPIQFSLEHLIRSRLPNLETPTKESRASGSTPRPSDQNPTSEEWVQKFLEQRWNRETNDWRSNDSDTEASAEEADVPIAAPLKRGHRDRNTNKTLNQQDFWRHFSKDQKEALGKMMASKYADPEPIAQPRRTSGTTAIQEINGLSPTAEKTPMPTPMKAPKPAEETPSKATNAGAFKANQEIMNKPLPDPPATSLLAPPGAAPAQVPRMRKKIMVKGKGCIISIPRDIPRGTSGFPPKPMSAADVDNKLRQLEQQGYDIRGFSTGGQETHNRAIWPSEADVQAERANADSRYKVRVSKTIRVERL
ncbi:MFS-1 domain containing protein [Pyrenophora tritici-repentis]|nr:MFS-1 domain containing protein [Pyrenophora tritici-repentis]